MDYSGGGGVVEYYLVLLSYCYRRHRCFTYLGCVDGSMYEWRYVAKHTALNL
jgi:hypothetical protein